MSYLALVLNLLLSTGLTTGRGAGEPLAWFAGCWRLERGTTVVEEQWLPPRAGVLLGTSRTVRNGNLAEYEFLVLRVAGAGATYEAHPSGQATTTFTAARIDSAEVVFENLQHDFPQRIGYRRVGRDSLLAWLEGPSRGTTRRLEFPYQRMACEAD